MRLIDADELITAFPCGETVRTECVRATIGHMPTIEERKKGKWFKQPFKSDKYVIFRCSECLRESGFGHIESKWANFCPNCGADMRGETNE